MLNYILFNLKSYRLTRCHRAVHWGNFLLLKEGEVSLLSCVVACFVLDIWHLSYTHFYTILQYICFIVFCVYIYVRRCPYLVWLFEYGPLKAETCWSSGTIRLLARLSVQHVSGKIISRNMLSWLELLISRYCCI